MIFTASNVSRQQNSFNFIQLNIFFRIIAEKRLTPPPYTPYYTPTSETSLSSRGLGHRPFTAVTGVRIPVGTPISEVDIFLSPYRLEA